MNNPPPLWVAEILENPEAIAAATEGVYPRELLGCGHYGCVMSTDDPAVVIKITRDPTEAPVIEILKELQERQNIQGFTQFFRIAPLKQVSLFGTEWPIYVIVREAVTPWRETADYHTFASTRTAEYLRKYQDEAGKWWSSEDNIRERGKVQSNLAQIISSMRQIPQLVYIASGLEEWVNEGYPPLTDVHTGNIGWNSEGHLVIFDPGHTQLAPPSVPEISHISPDAIEEVVADLDTEFHNLMEDQYEESYDAEPYDEWVAEKAEYSDEAYQLIEETASASFPLQQTFNLPSFPTTRSHLYWLKALIDWFELLDQMGGTYSEMGGESLNSMGAFATIIEIGQYLQGKEEEEEIEVVVPPDPMLQDVTELPILRTYLDQLIELEEAGILPDAVEIYQDQLEETEKERPMGLLALANQAWYSWEQLVGNRWRQEYFGL